MSNSFSVAMLKAFGASRGAYSLVTRDEYRKSQITLVGPEQELAEDFLGARLANHHGNVDEIRRAGHDPEVVFRVHPTGERVSLTLSYKTNKPRELRLYLRANLFKPAPMLNWCIFLRNGELWIGQFGSWMLDEIESGKMAHAGQRALLETETDSFQDVLNGSPPEQIMSASMAWKRDPRVAASVIKMSGYVCELQPDYPTFVSKGSGQAFVEAHHLVPMMVQGDFRDRSLDVPENICVLNPLVHRKLHHASLTEIAVDLGCLIERRRAFLDQLGLLPDDVLRLYD